VPGRRGDHVAAVAAHIQAGGEPTRAVAELAAGVGEVQVPAAAAGEALDCGAQLSVLSLERGERVRAGLAVDVEHEQARLGAGRIATLAPGQMRVHQRSTVKRSVAASCRPFLTCGRFPRQGKTGQPRPA
jgi:hypothetical protein